MKAVDRFYEDQKVRANWINSVSGQNIEIIDLSLQGTYGVSTDTLRKQLRADGWYTRLYGEMLYIAKRPLKYFS